MTDLEPDLPSTDDLRRLGARLDARLQEVNARIVLHDGRFAAMSDRINQTDRHADALSARIDTWMRSIDRRFDTADNRLDWQDERHQEVLDRLNDIERAPWWSHRRTGPLAAIVAVMALLVAGLAGLHLAYVLGG